MHPGIVVRLRFSKHAFRQPKKKPQKNPPNKTKQDEMSLRAETEETAYKMKNIGWSIKQELLIRSCILLKGYNNDPV